MWLVREARLSLRSNVDTGLGVIIAVMKHHEKNSLVRKGFIWFIPPYHSSSSKEVKIATHTGADAEVMEECCLLADCLWHAQPVSLQNQGPPA